MRINNAGHYEFCRWADKQNRNTQANIKDTAPETYFQQHMSQIRKDFLDGKRNTSCHECYKMEEHGKVSGRQKQLLKIGVRVENFEKTLASSPWKPVLVDSIETGNINLYPQDWQIDLGNYCNSACVFCNPGSSSRLANEFFKLKLINQLPPTSWCDDPVLVDKFLNTLRNSPKVKYLHFIGGETLITPAFKKILKVLIQSNFNKTVSIGFTTNLTVWDDEIVDLLCEFETVNLGVSIECLDPVNDYVRWPSQINLVEQTLDAWTQLSKKQQWLMQIRPTPSILTISRLLSLYDYAWDNGIAIESCNFLTNPSFLKFSVLPLDYRIEILKKMHQWLEQRPVETEKVINTRHPDLVQSQITQDLKSYINYLENEPDESHRLPDAVEYLKLLESNRGNCVIDYLPEYESLFRSAGY